MLVFLELGELVVDLLHGRGVPGVGGRVAVGEGGRGIGWGIGAVGTEGCDILCPVLSPLNLLKILNVEC